MPTIWTRHILDSAQIEKILPEENITILLLMLGQGQGFQEWF